MENVRILIANTCALLLPRNPNWNSSISAMDTDKIKVFGARLKVDSTGKLAELERAEKVRLESSVYVPS
jgi:T-complex protein 1 subunit beta